MASKIKDKILGFLFSPTGKGLIKTIPIVGELAGNILDENGAQAGKVDAKDMRVQLVRIGFYVLIFIAFLKGWITIDEAETFKDFAE